MGFSANDSDPHDTDDITLVWSDAQSGTTGEHTSVEDHLKNKKNLWIKSQRTTKESLILFEVKS